MNEIQKYEQCKANVEAWIDSLPGVSSMSNPVQGEVVGVELDNPNLKLTEEEGNAASKFPYRLRERNNSGVVVVASKGEKIKVDKEIIFVIATDTTSKADIDKDKQNKEVSEIIDCVDLNARLSVNSVEDTCSEFNSLEDSVCDTEDGSKMMKRIKVPSPLDVSHWTKDAKIDKMGAVVSTLNDLVLKVAEMDVLYYHPTDGVDVRLNTAQTQADSKHYCNG